MCGLIPVLEWERVLSSHLRLVRHMTASAFGIEDIVSDFLFVLCKESVRRFIKHVGYGHAAGLLMARGLLGGGASPNVDSYSPDEDSDTEEYKESAARWGGVGWSRVGWGREESWAERSPSVVDVCAAVQCAAMPLPHAPPPPVWTR